MGDDVTDVVYPKTGIVIQPWLIAAVAVFGACTRTSPEFDLTTPADDGSTQDEGSHAVPDTAPAGMDTAPGIDAAPGVDANADAPPALPAMVGWWKLDDDSGSMTALDSSGQGNDGRVEGLVLKDAWVAGRSGGAISFPPSTPAAGIRVPLSPSLSALRRVTVAAWINRVAANVAGTSQSGIVSQQDDDEPKAESFSLVAYLEDLEAFIATGTADQRPGSGPLGVFSMGAGTRQVWLHVAMTFDGSTLRLYRNGVELGQASITRPLLPTSNPIYLGTNKNGTYSQPFEGLLDDVLICAGALPAQAIAALAAGGDPASVCARR